MEAVIGLIRYLPTILEMESKKRLNRILKSWKKKLKVQGQGVHWYEHIIIISIWHGQTFREDEKGANTPLTGLVEYPINIIHVA